MADRSSARAFGLVFKHLADEPLERDKALARKLMRELDAFDFSPDQMGCDRALIALGVAKKGVRPGDPEDGEQVLYLGRGGWE